MRCNFEEEKYGFCVVIQAPDKSVSTWYGTGQDASKKWTDNDFHRERSGRQRGWDPVGTFIYDSINTFILNNTNSPRTIAFRREFYKTTVIVTEARKQGEGPWTANVNFFDLPAQEEVVPALASVTAQVHKSRTELVEAFQYYLKTYGSATGYIQIQEKMVDFQEAWNERNRVRDELSHKERVLSARENLRKAQDALRDLGE